MPKVRQTGQVQNAKKVRSGKLRKTAKAATAPKGQVREQARPAATTPFNNGRADNFVLKNREIDDNLQEQYRDAATLGRVPQHVDGLATVFGTARSRPTDATYVLATELGRKLREAPIHPKTSPKIATEGGFGTVAEALTYVAMKALGQASDPFAMISHDDFFSRMVTALSPFLSKSEAGQIQVYTDVDKLVADLVKGDTGKRAAEGGGGYSVSTGGGPGNMEAPLRGHADADTLLDMKAGRTIGWETGEPERIGGNIILQHEQAANPYINPDHLSNFKRFLFRMQFLFRDHRTAKSDGPVSVTGRMVDDLERGLTQLDGKPKSIAFFGGTGANTIATRSTVEKIARSLASSGTAMKVGGSPVTDQAVVAGIRASGVKTDLQAFALESAPVKNGEGLSYTRVNDVLVLRELMDTNIGGIVTTPEGALQLAMLFTAACDVQTQKLPNIPIVVLDPTGEFAKLKEELGRLMLTHGRKYISPEDLDIFTVTTDPNEALKALQTPRTPRGAPQTDALAPFKKAAAEAVVDGYVKSGMNLGIGTGSTMKFAVDRLGAKVKSGELSNLVNVSTSERTSAQAKDLGLKLSDLQQTPQLDLAIDGADEVAKVGDQFLLIKGLGGALLREKEVARHAKQFVVMVDDSKLVEKLGSKSPLPVEVDQNTWQRVHDRLIELGGQAVLRQDLKTLKPYVTDNGNYIIDVKWPQGIDKPYELQKTLDEMPGVKAHGLFLNMASEVVVAAAGGTRTLTRTDPLPADLLARDNDPTRAATLAAGKLLESASALPASAKRWLSQDLVQQAAVVDASVAMMVARARVLAAQQRGENPLPPLDRANLPKTEEEAIELTLNRLGMSAAEKATVHEGISAVLSGAQPPKSFREPIGGPSSFYPETFRTQMAITDPGLDHLGMTLADPAMLDGNWVHMEIIDRDTEHMAPYSNPGYRTLALVRLLLGADAPSSAFFGRPNYIASTLHDTVAGMDTASAGIKYNLPTAAHWMANSARSVLNMGYSEAKFGMDGLSPEEVITLGKAAHAQANLQEGEFISAAFNLNAVLKDFGLVPADAPQISGAPTPEQRALMLKGALASIDAAKEGGFKKVTVDSASMTPPSYPLIEYFSAENLLTWAHHAHEVGLETYGSGGMRDYHFPLLQLAGLDGVGVGFSIHDPAPDPKSPGKPGRLTPDKVLSEVALRNAAEKAPMGRAAVLLRKLDEAVSMGTVTPAQRQLRDQTFDFLKGVARGIDVQLDRLKGTRDAAVTQARGLGDSERKAAEGAARKAFEDAFKGLISTALNTPADAARATELLAQGTKLGVTA